MTDLISGSRRLTVFSLGLSLAQSLALIPIALLVRSAFDTAIPDEDTDKLVLIGAAILALYLLSLGLGLIGRHAVFRVTKPAVTRVREKLIEKVMWMPAAFFDAADRGRLHSLIVQDTERLDVMAKAMLAIVIPSLGVAFVLLASLVVIQPLLLAVLLIAGPILIGANVLMRRVVRPRIRTWQEQSDSFSSGVLSSLEATTLIKTQTAEEAEIARNSERAAVLGAAGQRMGWAQHAQGLVQVAVGGVAGVIVLIGGGIAVAQGSMSLGDLVAFMAVLALARGQLNWAVAALPDVLTGMAAIERIEEVLDRTDAEPYTGSRRIELSGALAWRDITFGYSRSEPPILERVTLEVAPSERLAILGPTGAGKTTLAALLLGLYRPWEGEVELDGTPLSELDVRGARRQMGVLLSDGATMRGTIAENIAFGREAGTVEIEQAAALAAAGDFIDDLPHGFETDVGDDGVRLSAGQRQRIALARALLGGPPVLILDEPTSHLDPETAETLLDNLEAIPTRPTLLLITHDPLVAERADRIVEVRGGRIGTGPALTRQQR